jgi:CHAT domain-containing protein/Tfp pilus assembly protein PilF
LHVGITLSFLFLPGFSQSSPLSIDLYENIIKADSIRIKGDFNNSISLYMKCLELLKHKKDKQIEFLCLKKLSLLYWNIGKIDAALEYSQLALAHANDINSTPDIKEASIIIDIIHYYNDGKYFRDKSEYEKSIDCFNKAIALSININSLEHELKCLRQLSIVFLNKNDVAEFYRLNIRSLDLSLKVRNEKDEGQCHNNIGLYFFKINNLSFSIEHFEKALTIAEKYHNNSSISDSLNNLSLVYTDMGVFDKAVDLLSRVLSLDKKLNDEDKFSMDLNNIGIVYRRKALVSEKKEDYKTALDYFNQALHLSREREQKQIELKSLNNIGSIYSQLNNYSGGLKYFNEALKIAEYLKDDEARSILFNNIGIINNNLGNYQLSTEYFLKAIDLAINNSGKQNLWELYLELGNTQKKQKRFGAAVKSYQTSISIIEDIRSSIVTEELRATYFGSDKRLDAYKNLVELLVEMDEIQPSPKTKNLIFSYLEKAKARSFLDSLEISNALQDRNSIDAGLINGEKQDLLEMSVLYRNLLMPDLSEENRTKIKQQLLVLEDRLEAIRREMRKTNPNLADWKYPPSLTLDEIQQKILNDRTLIVAYMVGKEKSFAFAITKRKIAIYPITPKAGLREKIESYMRIISDKNSSDFNSGYGLFAELIQPALINGIDRIIIVPDDVLYHLPFEALSTAPQSREWMIKNFSIDYIPSMASYKTIKDRRIRNKTSRSRDLLAVGDPNYGDEEAAVRLEKAIKDLYPNSAISLSRLDDSSRELKAIVGLFDKEKTTTLLGNQAKEGAFKKFPLKDYRILHFAAHSLIDDQKPMRSAVVLSMESEDAEDGFLQMREIYETPIHADLVVLSSCQTGLGRFVRGEGIEGMNRAFFTAGASAVLMTLWSINDQAGVPFMERFYRRLRSSETIEQAIQTAKKEMINSPYYSHPFYWAGYIISGETDRAIFNRSGKKTMVFITIGLTLLVFWGVRIARRRRGRI